MRQRFRLLGSILAAVCCAVALNFTGLSAPVAATEAVASAPAKNVDVVYAPVGSWVDVAPIPPAPADSDSAAVTRLEDHQHRIGKTVEDMFTRTVTEARNAAGMNAFRSLQVAWDPDHETIVVHWARLVRGDQVIDVLNETTRFEVLRREQGLETSILDGRLTATLQVPGARPGDILDFAYTRSGRDPMLKGQSDNQIWLESANRKGRVRFILLWEDGITLQWRDRSVKGAVAGPLVKGWRSLVYDQANYKADPMPVQAPARFRRSGVVDYSTMADWGVTADLMAPLYQVARTPAPDSPILKLADDIAATTPDPKARTLAALRLAQQEVRYFALGMGDGGLKPATADETWTRRFGDCKGKTVLFLALLDRLGVPAQPALVSIGSGEFVAERLPAISAFNHVLVRAEIDGKVFWLDPTGDNRVARLEHIEPPSFQWALPLQTRKLEAIDTPIPDLPQSENRIRVDFSGGIAEVAPAVSTIIYRGAGAQSMRLSLMSAGEKVVREQMLDPKNMQIDRTFTPESLRFIDDFEGNTYTIVMEGRARARWVWNDDVNRAQIGGNGGGWATRIRRDGPYASMPIAIRHPAHSLTVLEYVLPNGGAGFQVRGAQGGFSTAAKDLSVRLGIENGVAFIERRERSFGPEMSLAEHNQERRAEQDLRDRPFVLRAPPEMALPPQLD